MGLSARNPYQSANPASSQQQTGVVSPAMTGDLTSTQMPTVEQLSLSLQAVTRKVTVIEGRMSILESSFEILTQRTAELTEELRLTHEQLATTTKDLNLLKMERSRTTADSDWDSDCNKDDVDSDVLREEMECLTMGSDIGER